MKHIFPIFIILLLSASCQKTVPPPANRPIGAVTSTEGEVLITKAADQTQAAADQPLYIKDTIETKKGRIKITLNDQSSIALSDNSKIILTEFLIEEGTNFRKSSIGMAKGTLRSVVSKHFAGAGSEINIETPTVVAGIRGTELAITAEASESSVYCLDGAIEVFKPAEREKRTIVQKDTFIKARQEAPIEAPRQIPPEMRKLFFEDADFVPTDFRDKMRAFEEEYEAKKADLKAKELQMKKKMEEKREQVKEKMKKQEEQFRQKGESQKSKMDEKREEMLKKMREKMKH